MPEAALSLQPSHLRCAVQAECGEVLRTAALQPSQCSCLGRSRKESCCSSEAGGVGGKAREDCPSAAHGSGQATSHCSLAARPPQCLDPAVLGAPPFRHLSGALHLSRAQGCETAAMRPCSHKRDPFVLKGQGVGWDRDSRLHPTPTQAPGGVGC